MGRKQNKTNRGKKKRKMKSLLDNKMTLRWRIKCDHTQRHTQNVNFVRWIHLIGDELFQRSSTFVDTVHLFDFFSLDDLQTPNDCLS